MPPLKAVVLVMFPRALDAGESPAYMPRVMIRFLVTLLVLMSGLAAEGGAANARIYGTCAAVGTMDVAACATRKAPPAVTSGVAPASITGPSANTRLVTQPAAFMLPARTVLTGIDRARE